MPRYFTLAEAESCLPQVEHCLRDALFHKADADKAQKDLDERTQRIRMAGGSRVDPGPLLELRARRDRGATGLKAALEKIENIGAQIKDLNIGLIDFPTFYEDREVCLCWRLGEERIGFWHGIDEGFRGRKPIDEDFIAALSSDGPGEAGPTM